MDLLEIIINKENCIYFNSKNEFALNDMVVLESEKIKCLFKITEIERQFLIDEATINYRAVEIGRNLNKISFSTLNFKKQLPLREATNDEISNTWQWF